MPDVEMKLRFPRVTKVRLEKFSLYKSAPVIELTFPEGVFCLAGANGLGKSTFLSAINYAITGVVCEPNPKFQSVEESYASSLSYAGDYFSGRISEPDRKAAEVTVELSVGSRMYRITRGLFEPTELRELLIYEVSDSVATVCVDTSLLSPGERHERYAESITEDTGLASYAQLVFLQNYLLTFDESRHLLFWHQRVLEQVLYIAFAMDQNVAKRADLLRREERDFDSKARHDSWRATELRNKIGELEKEVNPNDESPDPDLAEKHRELLDLIDARQRIVDGLKDQIGDADLKFQGLSARHMSLRTEYEVVFNQHFNIHSNVQHHPLIRLSIGKGRCELCGAEGESIVRAIEVRSKSNICPLCNNENVDGADGADLLVHLQNIDTEIGNAQKELDSLVQKKQRLQLEQEAALADLKSAVEELCGFERANEDALQQLNRSDGQPSDLDVVLEKYRQQMALLIKNKLNWYARRDEKRRELAKLQHELESKYTAAEMEFVPLFKNLAGHFLGLDLDVRLETPRSSPELNLVLEITGSERRQPHQLSESQRFFVDIALRMALSQYMADPASTSSLFIDTPEGSLDIAYEKRAGDMFAIYVSNGHHIIMTANINTSRLIQSLAQRCGREKMEFSPMTSWTELSDVQIAEEEAFKDAYTEIDAAFAKHEVSLGA